MRLDRGQAHRIGLAATTLSGRPRFAFRASRRAEGATAGRGFAGRGHTLFELAMVLSIITVVAAIAAPRFAGADQRYRADAAARRIAADLQYVSRTARGRGASQSVSFSVTSASYTSSARPLDGGPDEPYVVRLDVPPYGAGIAWVDFEGGTEIIFNGHGMPDRGGEVVVEAGRVSRRVVVSAATGEVTVE